MYTFFLEVHNGNVLFSNGFAETLTAAEFEKTEVTIEGKSGELHPLADYGDVASAKGFNQSDLQTFCNILYCTNCTSINAP